ncbi:CPBP family intramembrane glutamic endopeptidase [Planococcus halotolerans]|uniref:CPBP family intramembrane glutamic endopeptidase n=1 Tax=Planococcus halotolerans TaxID=2233542 RepID=UPI0013676E8F|nr:type II CAAX endopeptidase family protein [Planococcus halotolerans]QHJ72257.1 CPBP family intramembrane metalloprotease [Planococcus halotolerans]
MFEEKRSRFVIGLMTVVAIMSISLLLQATGNLLLHNVVMLLVFYTVLPFWICSYYFQKNGIKLRQILFFTGTARWLLPVAGLTVLLLAFSISIYWLMLRGLASLSPIWVEYALTRQPLPDEWWYVAASGFIIAILAPIAEEFVFRGVIMHRLTVSLGLWKGVGLSSLFFSIFHINILGSFLFAVVASLLYLKTGTLLVPILLHIFNNCISVFQYTFNPSFPEWLMVTSIDDLYSKTAPNLIVLVVSLVSLLLFIKWVFRDLEIR